MEDKIKEIIDKANNMKKNQNIDEYDIAKFVHIELGKLIIYDNSYTAKYKDNENISERSERRQKKLLTGKTNVNKEKQICKGMAEIYSSILTEVGINSKVYGVQSKGDVKDQKRDDGSKIIIGEEYKCNFNKDFSIKYSEKTKNEDSANHYYTVINIEDKRYISDFLIDSSLFRIKDGEVSFDNEKIPGFCNESDYENRAKKDLRLSPKYLYSLMDTVKNMSDNEKLKYIFDKINSMGEKIGFEESKDLIMTYAQNIFSNNFDFRKIKIMNLVKETEINANVISIYEYNGKDYLLKGGLQDGINSKNGEISLENIMDIVKNGFEPRKVADSRMFNQINMEIELKLLLDEYNKKLATYSNKSIENVFTILDEKKKKIQSNSQSFSKNEYYLDLETSQIFNLMKKYSQDIKQIFVKQKAIITHITDVPPKEMIGGKISKSINRANNYETEIGDWVFASSNPIEGKNPYIARNSKSGMVLIDKNTYIYGDNNIKIQQDKQGNNIVKLKKPNYVYNINPEKFNPVVTIKKQEGKPVFEFSEEWISDQEVDINDTKQVLRVDEIDDITDVIKNYQILCDVNQADEAIKIKNSHSKEEALNRLINDIQNGSLRYVNAEANINVSPLLKQNEKIEKNYTITPNQIEKKSVYAHIGIKEMAKEIVNKKIYERTHQEEIEKDSHNYNHNYGGKINGR